MANSVDRAKILLEIYKDLGWTHYIKISDEVSRISKSNLEEELIKQPSLYSYYAGLLAIAKAEKDHSKLDLEQYVATTRKKIKQDSSKTSTKKLTKDDVEDIVVSDDEHKRLSKVCVDKTYKYDLLKALVDSINQRHDSLIQLSANHRAETHLYSKT